MGTIQLTGNKKYLTNNNEKSYVVLKGNISVYVVICDESGITGRKHWIADINSGEVIPSIYIKDSEGIYTFELAALTEAVLDEEDKTEEHVKKFSEKVGINISEDESIEEAVIELINLKKVTEEGYIYSSSKEEEKVYEKSLKLIYNQFHKDYKTIKTDSTGNILYDTVAFLCSNQNIKLASFDSIKEGCGRKFSIEDIARLSHFSIRKVILEENWFKQDSGPLIVFTNENKPVACIPQSPKKYIAYNLFENTVSIIDNETAEKFLASAYMIYRPFPDKKLNVKDLVTFGFKGVYKYDIYNIILFSFISTIIGLFLPYLTQKIYDNYISFGDKNMLVGICLLYLAFIIGNMLFTIVKNFALLRFSNCMAYSVQNAFIDRLYNLPNNFINKFESADLIKRTLGASAIFKLLSETIVSTVLAAVFSLLYLLWMFKYSGRLAVLGITMVLCNVLVTLLLGKAQVKYEKKLLETETDISSKLYQIISNISKIRIAGVEDRALIQYLEPYIGSKKIYYKKEGITNIAKVINIIFNALFTVVFYYYLINKNIGISYGGFIGFLSAFGMFSAAVINCVTAFLSVNHCIPIYNRIKPILETTQETSEDVIVPGRIDGGIEVSNVSFSYGEKSGNVLSKVSFKIEPGEYVGIVGTSGSGKSTLLKLLLGFEKPDIGKIYYDDMDIDRLDKRELRKRFGVVLQDGQLIGGSIYENISIASPGADLEKVNEAVHAVGLEDDIKQMPMGLHTVVSEGGGTISGGQRQRILIARAIMNKPRLLFLDEATSALDNVNQSMVCESLEKLNATRIVIAHRLSTVINCDKILVMDNGTIAEEGSYGHLMDKKGMFFNLVKRQML